MTSLLKTKSSGTQHGGNSNTTTVKQLSFPKEVLESSKEKPTRIA